MCIRDSFLYSRAFQMMVGIGDMRVMEVLAEATRNSSDCGALFVRHARILRSLPP